MALITSVEAKVLCARCVGLMLKYFLKEMLARASAQVNGSPGNQ